MATPNHDDDDDFVGDFAGNRRAGSKWGFAELEDDIFGSKKANSKLEETAPGVATGMILTLRESLQKSKEELEKYEAEKNGGLNFLSPLSSVTLMASLQTRTKESVFTKLSKLRNLCNNDIQVHQQKIDSYFLSFDEFLQSQKSKAQLNAENDVKLGKLKVELRKLEDEFVRALAVKTRKEAKRIALTESLSETKVKVDELQKIVRDQEARKDEYAAILAEQSKDLAEFEKKAQEAVKNREEIQEAFTWYNKALGFRIEGGHGVKFTFTNINKKIPAEEYSFTIRYSNDIYTLLDCNPHLNNLEHMIHELNKSNCLFRFVRIMREKFQAASSGSISHVINHDQDSTSISLSAPAPSVSTDSKSQSPLPLREVNRDIEEANHKVGYKSPHLLLSPRRSPRLVEEVCREVNSWASRATKGL